MTLTRPIVAILLPLLIFISSCGRLIIRFFLTASAVLLVACSDGPVTGPIQGQRYPTTYARLSSDSLATLDSLFSQANPRICSGLNEFGFTALVEGGSFCIQGTRSGVGEDAQIEHLIDNAKVILAQNAQFTGVREASSLSLAFWTPIRNLQGDILDIRVRFEPQVYQGLQFQFADIQLMIDSVGILSISGNHFPDIYVPNPVVLPSVAQRTLEGRVLIWYDFGGSPIEYRVSEVSFCQDTLIDGSALEPMKVILPHETERGIELRVAWRFNVGCDLFHFSAWWMYVDIVTGELLFTVQLFVT